MTKTIEQLSKEIAKHLDIDPLPIKFEELGNEDSRLYTQEEYVGINKKYKDDYEELAKCIAHEYRHVFQIFYASLFQDGRATRWKGLLKTQINSSTMNDDGSNYINQELEIDAFASTKFYLENLEDIEVINRIDGLDKYLDLYIENNKRIM